MEHFKFLDDYDNDIDRENSPGSNSNNDDRGDSDAVQTRMLTLERAQAAMIRTISAAMMENMMIMLTDVRELAIPNQKDGLIVNFS